MSLTIQARKMHEVYENLPANQQEAIDNAVCSVMFELARADFKCAHDDRAEELASAITAYALASK